MRFGYRDLTAVAAVFCVLVSAIPAAALDVRDQRSTKLGRFKDTQPHKSGLMYVAPARTPSQAPKGGTSTDDSQFRTAPFSLKWLNDCAARHKNFDPQTGTYLSDSGAYKFCD